MANAEHNPFPQSNSNKLFHFGNKVISFHLTSTSKWLLELALSIYIAITLTIVLAISFALGICMLYIYYSAWYRIVFLAVFPSASDTSESLFFRLPKQQLLT